MLSLDGNFIFAVAPKFSGQFAEDQRRIIDAISPVFAETLDTFDINTRLRIAHFMGQVTHECAGFRTTEEFASGKAYEGRKDLGNTQPGDGPRYKGRGLLQLTGRANYREFGKELGLDLEDDPELAGEPAISLKIACQYWKNRKINKPADEDDLIAITRKVNGGQNGLEDRRKYLQKAKALLAGAEADQEIGNPVLHRGVVGSAVGRLQNLLRKKGFQIAIDDEFGAATELAVKMLQDKAKLTPDGIVGPKTWALLAT